MKKTNRILTAIGASLLILFVTPVAKAELEATVQKQKVIVQLPDGVLNFSTNFNGQSPEGWRPGKVQGETQPEDREVNLEVKFEDGETLNLKRILEVTENAIKGNDTITIDKELSGGLHYDITLPMDAASKTVIETENGEVLVSELSSLEKIEYFLKASALESVKLRNYLGANITVHFPPSRFEVMAVPNIGIIHLRMFFSPNPATITDVDTQWSLEVSPAE